ncbi:MAG: signal recognition particle subunit SRP54 [Chloroflexi bacterium]|nr:MAG: signal recognition particle subunit SRP54 [Chloroflexota bacterium]
MFENLTDKLQGAFGRLGRRGTLTEKDLDEALREIRMALLEADVNYKVAKDFIKTVRARALTDAVLRSTTPTQLVINIVNEELVTLLGGESPKLHRSSQPPTVIMLVGLQGAGKTTTASKLAVRLRRGGDRPLLIAADVYRPAAIEQLKQLGKQLDIAVYEQGAESPPREIVANGLKHASKIGAPIVIVDTAGRLHIDEVMMEEIRELERTFSPSEVLLVADAMSGQDAVSAAQAFHEAVNITGVILTKMDGDARGGAALSIRAVTGAPIKFLGTGEKADALEPFHPDRLASRILGQGDMASLVEKAKEEFGDEDAKKLKQRMADGSFGLDDFIEQFKKVQNMGSISQLLGMIPGMGNIKQQLNVDELDDDFFSKVEAIISSMTPDERRKPDILNGSRRRRIASGSGTTIQDVNQLLNQFKEARKMMKAMAGGRMDQLLVGARR